AHLFVEMHDDFGIGVGVKLVAAGDQFFAQFREIVDFAVEHDPDRLVFVVDGLVSAGEVNDAEPAHAEPGSAAGVDALVVRPAVDDGAAHAPHGVGADGLAFPSDQPGYSAHRATSVGRSGSASCARRGLTPRTETGRLATCRSSRPLDSNQRKTSS